MTIKSSLIHNKIPELLQGSSY